MKIVSGKYALLEPIHEGSVRSYRARHITLGHELMLHFVAGSGPEENFALLDQLSRLPDRERKLFIDAGEHESVPYIVSWPLPEFDSLPAWLERALARRAQEPAPPSRPQPGLPRQGTSTDAGEFTRLFFGGVKEPPAASPQIPPSPAEPVPGFAPPQKPPEPPAPPQPGEFTRFFGGPAVAPPRPETAPVFNPAPEPAPTEPPAPAASAAPVPVSAPHATPGEFTQFFGGPADSPPRPVEIAPVLTPPPERSPAEPPLPPAPAACEPTAAGSGDLTRFFDTPAGFPPSPPKAAASSAPVFVGSGDYASVVRPAPPPAPAPAPPAARSPAPAGSAAAARPDYRLLWLGLGVLFVIAVAFVLFFALRK